MQHFIKGRFTVLIVLKQWNTDTEIQEICILKQLLQAKWDLLHWLIQESFFLIFAATFILFLCVLSSILNIFEQFNSLETAKLYNREEKRKKTFQIWCSFSDRERRRSLSGPGSASGSFIVTPSRPSRVRKSSIRMVFVEGERPITHFLRRRREWKCSDLLKVTFECCAILFPQWCKFRRSEELLMIPLFHTQTFTFSTWKHPHSKYNRGDTTCVRLQGARV